MTEREIFLAALKQPSAGERAAFLDQACGSDANLRGHIEALLAEHEQLGSYLEPPVATGQRTVDKPPITEGPGTIIGPYKLLQVIGEGGMGVVWMAEQTQPVRRKVALKVIKPGMDSRQVIARFEAERQALALMDHVNIARVFDGGATENGRPYFVMELVHGVSIIRYCDDNHLTPRQRLELFVPVCQAVQHAHQKGVIHRDVKPSNVLVTLYDGKPVPKVIDFGVAKATEQKLTERTLFTQYGTLVGTLEYMSPEQAEMSALGVDTRSDIYSLGVLLYELLTGTTPLTSKRMKEAAYAEILRMIKEEEPPKPSTRLSDSGESLASISVNRHTEPAKLTKLVRGELDWIVMKCLEKDRNRRYETANGFAADVQRYLADEPVQACPPSAWYRFRKFARRNKRALATTSFIVLALLATLVTLAVSNLIILRERDAKAIALGDRETALIQAQASKEAAEKQRQRAEDNLQLSVNLLDQFLLKPAEKRLAILQQERHRLLATNQERVQVELELIEKGAAFYAQLAERDSADSSARLKAATAHYWLGFFQHQMGQQDKSVQTYRQGLRFLENSTLAQQEAPTYAQIQADLYLGMCRPLFAIKRFAEAEEVTRRGLGLYEKLVAAGVPADEHGWGQIMWSYVNLGCFAAEAGRNLDAEEAFIKARAVGDAALRALPRNIEVRYQKAGAGEFLGTFYAKAGRLEEAIAAHRVVVKEFAKLAQESDSSEFRWRWGVRLHALGQLLEKADQAKGAEQSYLDAFPIWQKLVQDYQLPDHRYHLGRNRELAGQLLRKMGRLTEAAAAYQAAITVWEKLVAEFNRPDHRGHLGSSQVALKEVLNETIERDPKDATPHYGLGLLLNAQGKLEEAIACYRKAIELDPKYVIAHAKLAHAFKSQGKLDEAIACYRKVIEIDPKCVSAHNNLGYALMSQGKLDEAIACYRNSVKLDAKSTWAHNALGSALMKKGWNLANHPDPKLRDLKRAVEASNGAVESAPQSVLAWQYLGWVQYRAGNWKASIEALEKSCKLQEGGTGDYGQWVVMSLAHGKLANEKELPEQERARHQAEARRWFDQSVKQIGSRWSARPSGEFDQAVWDFRAEAAELLGIKEKHK